MTLRESLQFLPRISLHYVLLLVLCFAPGCAWTRFSFRPDSNSFNARTPCRLPKNPTVDDLVSAVNENVDRLQAWRAGRVKLHANHMPMGLEADLAVEKGRHLRLVVRHPLGGGDQLDLGCNDEIFWFWAKQAQPKAVMYASHDQLDQVRESLQIPFEPDLLMEALGVSPIDPAGMSLEPVPGTRTARLVSHHHGKQGRTVRKTITVDTCHGRVLEYTLWDSGSKVRLFHAEFSNHRIDPATGVIMPHHIQLDWQQADLSLSLDLGSVDVNPRSFPERIWEMPRPHGYASMNLEEFAAKSPRSPGVRQTAIRAHEIGDDHEIEGHMQRPDADAVESPEEPEFMLPQRKSAAEFSDDFADEPYDFDAETP